MCFTKCKSTEALKKFHVRNIHQFTFQVLFHQDNIRGLEFYFWQHPARLDTRTAGVTRQCSRKDGSFPYLHT